MKRYLSSGIALSVVLALAGCGGGGGGTTPTATTTAISGTASDGYLSGSTVCFDANANGSCDAGEPVTVTDANGSYSLDIAQTVLDTAVANAPLLVSGGIDIDSKSPLVGSLRAPFSAEANANITPLTTMAHALVKEKSMSADEAYAKVASALGLSEEEVKADPVALAAQNNTKVIAASMALNRIVTMLTEVAGDETTADTIYNSLSNAIESAAADTSTTNKGVANVVVLAAEDPNSSLPPAVKEAAVVAPIVESQVVAAVESNPTSLADAAAISDAVVETIQEEVATAIENNTTIDETLIQTIEDSATQTADETDPIVIAIENIFSAYTLFDPTLSQTVTLTEAEAQAIQSELNFTDSASVKIEDIVNHTFTDTALESKVELLRYAYRVAEVKVYLTALGHPETSWSDPHLDEAIASLIPDFTSEMSPEEFSTKLYATGEAELMSLALSIAPPESIASLSDVERAKQLLESIRTQINSVSNSELTGYADTESEKIDNALTDIAINMDYLTDVLDTIVGKITDATDANQTTLSTDLSGTRDLTITKNTASSDVEWSYEITQNDDDGDDVTSWSGTVSYPDIDEENFDASSFEPLHVVLTGDLPRDYVAVTDDGEDKQSVNLDATLTKTEDGADFTLNASVSCNGDSVSITDASLSIAYTTDNEGEVEDPTHVTLHKLYVNGTAGDYTLDGKLDVNAYTQNSIMAAKGGFEIESVTTRYELESSCQSDIVVNDPSNSFAITFNGKTYYPEYVYTSPERVRLNYTIDDENVTEDTVEYAYTLSCADTNEEPVENVWINWWTEDEPNNSGYLPSDISFNGKLSNNVENSYFDGSVTAKWLDAATADLDNEEYEPEIEVSMSGALQMPESQLMTVQINYENNTNGSTIHTVYVSGDLSVTADSELDSELENGTIEITTSSDINAHIKLVDGDIDNANSTLTTIDGKTVGNFVDIDGVPSVRYVDGSFESLP